MPTLGEIRGQDRAIAHLRQALSTGRVPHAYLFAGPAHGGKHATGLALAAALNCDRAPNEGCGTCATCERILSGVHPDVQTLERTGAARIINIKTVRQQVVAAVGLPPHEARARVFLVEEANDLQGPGANALLKTLEEPPARTHFVLATVAPDKLLPTIRSRCQKLTFAALPLALRAELATGEDSDMQLETHNKLDRLSDTLLAAVDHQDGNNLRVIFDAAAEVSQERTEVAPALRLLSEKLHLRARDAVERHELGDAARMARRASLVLDTELAVTMHNAHGQLALETLLSQLRAVR